MTTNTDAVPLADEHQTYIFLAPGDVIRATDERYSATYHKWKPIAPLYVGTTVDASTRPVRRRAPAFDAQAEAVRAPVADLYVWLAGSDDNRFIRAWTDDPAKVSCQHIAVRRAAQSYRLGANALLRRSRFIYRGSGSRIMRTIRPALRNGRPSALKGDSDNLEHLADGLAFAHAKFKEGFQAHPLGLTRGSVRPLDNNRGFCLARGEAYVNQKPSDKFLYAHIDHGSLRLFVEES